MRPLFSKLLLLFVVFFLAAHWGYLLLELDVTAPILAQGTDQALALLPASFRQIAAAFCCLLPCSALGLPLAGARCHRSHFGSRYRSSLSFAAGLFSAAAVCCLLPCSALGYLLLELDVTVAILAQGTDQALALLPASFRQIAAAFCCLLPCSALGLPLAGARCHRSHFGSRYRSGLGFAAGHVFGCLLPCSALGRPLAGARCHRSHFGSRYRSGLGFAAGLFSANCCCFLLSSSLQRTGASSCWS